MRKQTVVYLLAALIGIALYFPLLFKGQPLERDDIQFLTPLASIHSVHDYVESWKTGKIFDIAPLRDLTYIVDLKVSGLIGAPTYHFTNLLLYFLFVALAISVIESAVPFVPSFFPLLFMLHPVYAVSVGWITGRKHILAAIFALAATKLLLCEKKRFTSFICYLLSVLSFPYLLVWPLWAGIYFWSKEKTKKQAISYLWPHLLLMIAMATVNLWYYTTLFLTNSGGISKFAEITGPGIFFLCIGRAIFNLLSPMAVSPVDYFPGSPENFIGLGLLFVVLFACRHLRKKDLFLWLSFFALPLLMVNLRPTRVFLSDTYLLFPSLGVWILLLHLPWKKFVEAKKILIALFVPLALVGFFLSREIVLSMQSIHAMYDLAYAKEPTPQVRLVHGMHLFEVGKFRQAAEIAHTQIDWNPEAANLFAQAITADPSLSSEKKKEALQPYLKVYPFLQKWLTGIK